MIGWAIQYTVRFEILKNGYILTKGVTSWGTWAPGLVHMKVLWDAERPCGMRAGAATMGS